MTQSKKHKGKADSRYGGSLRPPRGIDTVPQPKRDDPAPLNEGTEDNDQGG